MKFKAPNRWSTAFLMGMASVFLQCAAPTPKEQEEWQTLFNGKDLQDWIVKIHHHELGDNYANTFRVEEGLLRVNYDGYKAFDDRFGHLFYKEPFADYHLVLEYRFTDRWLKDAPEYTIRNSGLMFHAQDPKTIRKEQDWPISLEMQFLAGLEDGEPRTTGNLCTPGTEVVYQGIVDPRHCIDSSSKTYALSEWVKAELIVWGDSLVTHLINGDTVLQYSKPHIGGEVKHYDPAVKQDGKALTEGYIALQSEGQAIDFRNIKLKRLIR